MKKKTLGLLGFVAVVVLIAGPTGCRGCGSADKTSAPVKTAGLDRIQAMTPKRMDFSVRSRWFGTVRSTEAVSLVALESGRIFSVDAPDESETRKGTLLFTIGGPQVRNRSKGLKARIASLRERKTLAEAAVALKEKAVAQKMARKTELLSAREKRLKLESELREAEATFAAFRKGLKTRAPLDGVITGRRVNAGQEVKKGDILAELIPLESLRIIATLFPPEKSPLVGLPASVERPDGKEVHATVTKVRPRRTPKGATTVWLEGKEIHKHFAPGETVSGRLVLSRHENALALPLSAIVRDEQERAFVFIKGPGGYHQQSVKTGEDSDGWVEIKEGVGEEDGVVVRGAYELFYQDYNRAYKVED